MTTNSLSSMGYIFVHPKKAFDYLRKEPRWLLCYLLVAVCTAAAAAVQIIKPMQVPEGFEVDAAKFQSYVQLGKYIASFSAGALILVRCLIAAGIVYALLILVDSENTPPFKTVFAIVMYAQLIITLAVLIQAGVSFSIGLGNPNDPYRPQSFLGLHAIISDCSVNPALCRILSSITPFTVWHLIILGIGIASISNQSKLVGILIACVPYFVFVAFSTLLFTILQNFAKGMS